MTGLDTPDRNAPLMTLPIFFSRHIFRVVTCARVRAINIANCMLNGMLAPFMPVLPIIHSNESTYLRPKREQGGEALSRARAATVKAFKVSAKVSRSAGNVSRYREKPSFVLALAKCIGDSRDPRDGEYRYVIVGIANGTQLPRLANFLARINVKRSISCSIRLPQSRFFVASRCRGCQAPKIDGIRSLVSVSLIS